MRTVVDAIVDSRANAGTLTVLAASAEPAEVVSWRDLSERAKRMAAVLAGAGLGPGCRVGVLGASSVPLAAAVQAIWFTGGAVTVLPPGAGAARAGHLLAIIRDAGLDAVLVDRSGAAVAGALPAATQVMPLESVTERADAAAPAVPHRPGPTDLAVLQYTSGSTRAPRGVPVSHGHLAANLDAMMDRLDHGSWHPGRWLSWLPLYHDMGLVAFFTLPVSCGCSLILQPPGHFARRPSSWLEAMSRYRITISGAPNFAYALMTRLLAGEPRGDLDLASVRFLVTGGEPVDAAMMARFAAAAGRRGLDPAALMPAYGLAEATLAATLTRPQAGLSVDRIDPVALEARGVAAVAGDGVPARELVRVGAPVGSASVRVVDRYTGEPVPDRSVGHIELRGESVVGYYWGDPRPAPDAWLRTGDLGYLTGDGELVVCGREKDILFAAGRNVFPQDVEAVAEEVPGVRPGGAAAFGLPGGDGDRLVVAVESRNRDSATVRQGVAAVVLAEVGLAPKDVVVVPYGHLPKTSSGKLRRTETRRRYLSGELGRALEVEVR
jgi:fatty-acyl-CoA synthase